MKSKTIKYLVYYASLNDREQRDSHILAAFNFINYECELLNNLGYELELISASRTRSKTKYYGRREETLNNGIRIKYLPTFPKKNRFYGLLDRLSLDLSLFLELLKCKKNENVIVYHSMASWNAIELAHKIRHFKWILYVGEIFGDVSQNMAFRKKEVMHCSKADSYILATEHLNKIINKQSKPYVVLYGAYKNELDRNNAKREKDSSKIHCVYAGTFDSRKGEAQLAVRSAEYLSNHYCVHICGFGSDKDTEELLAQIKRINEIKPGSIIYEGRLSGEDFICLLQKCDIGLFTPIAEAEFNNTDFPSKIFSYLTNGLYVVSASVEPVRCSKVSSYLKLYDGSNPEEIAKAIMEVDINDGFDGRAFVSSLEKEFIDEINKIL